MNLFLQLQSTNMFKAKAIDENVFKRFLEEAHVDVAFVASCVGVDHIGAILVSLVDRFGCVPRFSRVEEWPESRAQHGGAILPPSQAVVAESLSSKQRPR